MVLIKGFKHEIILSTDSKRGWTTKKYMSEMYLQVRHVLRISSQLHIHRDNIEELRRILEEHCRT